MPILMVMGSVWGLAFVGLPVENPPTTSYNLSMNSFASVSRRLPGIPMSNYGLPIPYPFGGIGVDLKVRKWYQSKCRTHIPIRLLYTLQAYFVPFGQNTQRGRQTYRQTSL